MTQKKNTKQRKSSSVNRLVIMIFLVAITSVITRGIVKANLEKKYEELYEEKYEYYEVQRGDTAYSIAERYKYPGQDSRDYIEKISDINGKNLFGSRIRIGEVLLVIKYSVKERKSGITPGFLSQKK